MLSDDVLLENYEVHFVELITSTFESIKHCQLLTFIKLVKCDNNFFNF